MNSRIMIVEDEYIVAADLEAKLTKLGYQVIGTAASGDEALSLAEEQRPHIVLMDIQLQGTMSGIDAGTSDPAENRRGNHLRDCLCSGVPAGSNQDATARALSQQAVLYRPTQGCFAKHREIRALVDRKFRGAESS